jgi:MYXO-CTERM domain-containing protein
VDVAGPLVTRDLIGINPITKQGIENHDGSPITIDKDIAGTARSTTHPTAGPFEALASGSHTYTFLAGAGAAGVWGQPGNVAPTTDGGTAPVGDSGSVRGDAASRADGAAQKDGGSAGTAGAASTDVPTEDEYETTETPGGCGCRVAGTSGSYAWALALAAMLQVARRRRDALKRPICSCR